VNSLLKLRALVDDNYGKYHKLPASSPLLKMDTHLKKLSGQEMPFLE